MSVGSRARWLGPAAVLASLLAVAFGGRVVSSVLEEPEGATVGLDGLLIRPLSGWEEAGSGEAGGWTFFRLTRGTGNLDVSMQAPATSGDATVAAIRYVDDVLRRSLVRLSVSEGLEPVSLEGRPGVRFAYAGVVVDTRQPIEGEVTVVWTGKGGVAFDAWTPEGQLAFALGDINAMIESATIDAASG
jgi:hypothetical protein